MEDFMDVEDRDGVRLSWNVLPVTIAHEKQMVIPMGVLYSPLKKSPQPPPLLQYDPVVCKGPCRTVLNPFCSVDIAGKLWVCPFCFQRNPFPARYGNLQSSPPELVPHFTTVEYRLSKPYSPPPAFLFVVDLSLPPESLQHVKDSLMMAISLLPEVSHVGLITFSETVKVYELAFEPCPKSYVFSGKKDVDSKNLSRMLGMGNTTPSAASPSQQPSYRFVLPLSECQMTLENIVEGLLPNSWPPKKGCRSMRSSGAALSIGLSLLENLRLNCAGRIMSFLGGPCTHGPGKVVEPPLKDPMRAHFDLEKDNAKFAKEAYNFYDSLANRAAQNGHIVDIFAGCLDQVGTMEMRQLVQKTGGYLVNAESFEHNMFKDSFRKIFARDGNQNLNMGFNVNIQVQMSKELKIMGAIGHLVSLNKSSPSVSQRTIGESGTTVWKISGIDPLSTFGFYFSVVNQDQAPKRNQKGLIQFTTSYMDSSGAHILRVTTIGRPFVTNGVPGQQQEGMMDTMNPKAALSAGFDQEAAAVLLARMAVFKTREESPFDVIRWLDRTLISVSQQFGEYLQGDSSSFRLGRSFGLLPQFMFHLRRSCLLQNFNSSPDESTYYRYMLLRENCPNSMTMIQPRLEAYTFQQRGFPVLLSSTSLAPDRILMLDTFFHVVIWHGKSISEWKAKGYQNDPNYASFRDLLNAPQEDAKITLEERIPTPMFKSCPHDHGDSRYLLAVIDPAQTYSSNAPGQAGEVIPTDDANLQVFVEHLAKLTVAKS